MTHTKHILIAAAALVVLMLAGCSESSNRTSAAQRRWNRTMEEARIEAAQQSIEQGRLEYGVRLLEDLIESESVYAEQAKQILAELRAAKNEIAQARAVTTQVKL